MQVREIMEPVTTNWLKPEQTLFDAIRTMRQTKWLESSVHGMVVLENGSRLVGIVSIKDVIRAVLPPYLIANLGSFTWDGMLEERSHRVRTMLVKDIMSKDLVTVHPDDLVIECADFMIRKQFQRLPIVDDSGTVLGMVHIRDVYLAITDYICGEGD